jgi:Flp pilus assembly protein TadD
MDPSAKIHWLKHLCTRPIESYTTFSVDLMKGPGRVLRLFVAVNATQTTWEPLQGIVIGKLKSCLEEELVNQVLREMLQVEFKVDPSLDPPSGPTPWLPNVLRDDLDNLPHDLLRPQEHGPVQPTVESPALLSAPLPRQPPAVGAPRSSREFKVIAVPPERLAEFLCNSGCLTVISNTYVSPEEETVGGMKGATSRFFVGPADSGKTRAALEWLKREIGPANSQWVIFRTDIETLPRDIDAIVLDRTLYGELPLPTKAVLFLDDLPQILPPAGDDVLSAEEAVRAFFRWFRELPFLRERRVVGTMRLEDVHSRPEWPDVLPSLGQELEMVRLHPLDENKYRELWEGMDAGEISRSMTRGIESFKIDLTLGFLEAVTERSAEPEAVATFVQQNVLKAKIVLSTEDAANFSESAVDTWLKETWPAVQQAYGVAARVFFTLARFVESGLRPMSGFPLSMGPKWTYHERWGPELCELHGGAAGTYLPILEKLIADGHATGERGVRIRPKLDFLLQAENLSGVELSPPDLDWYIQRSNRLEGSDRMAMARQFSSLDMEGPSSQDADLLRGWGIGSLQSSERPENKTRQSALLDRSIINLKNAIQLDSNDSLAWSNLGVSLFRKADQENNLRKSDELRDEAMAACRSATQTDSQNSQGWNTLGASLSRKANQENNPRKVTEILDEAIVAYRNSVQADPKNFLAWNNLGYSLNWKAYLEEDHQKAAELRDEAIAACQSATQADPKFSYAWNSLGAILVRKANQVDDPQEAAELRDEAMAAYRSAIQADPKFSDAWNNLGASLNRKAYLEKDHQKAAELRDEAMTAYRSAIQADPKFSDAWNNLGASLNRKAYLEKDRQRAAELRDEAMRAYRSAIQADPKNGNAWYNLGISLDQKAEYEIDPQKADMMRDEMIEAFRSATQEEPKHSTAWNNLGVSISWKAEQENDPQKADKLRDEAECALRRATQEDPNDSEAWDNLSVLLLESSKGSHQKLQDGLEAGRKARLLGAGRYNFACGLALNGEETEALTELTGCLERREISREHVAQDLDWEHLRTDSRFRSLLESAASESEECPPDTPA